jgi:hypothetical protein
MDALSMNALRYSLQCSQVIIIMRHNKAFDCTYHVVIYGAAVKAYADICRKS